MIHGLIFRDTQSNSLQFGDALTAALDVESRSLWRSRLGKGARFVAIVWGLAGALLGLQYLESRLLATALEKGVVDARLVTQSVAENAACGHRVAELQPAELDDAGSLRSWRQTFELGLGLGFEAGADHVRLAGGEAPLQPSVDRTQLAAELGVPAPEIPAVGWRTRVFQEFANHVAADPQCVAASLARVYSPRHAALFRLGAVVGASVTYRRLGLAAATFGPNVRIYGAAASVPQDLLAPLIGKGDPDDPEGVRDEAGAALDRLLAWASDPETPGG